MPAASSASRIASTVRSLSSSPRSNLATVSIVCALSETSTPHRMGAALTYARRYALFTLVGLAGEDDLDAPDLTTAGPQNTDTNSPTSDSRDQIIVHGPVNRLPAAAGKRAPSTNAILAPDQSAVLRERLIQEIQELNSSEAATSW